MSSNPYKILGLEHGSSDEDVKKAYKTLARKHHPDKGGTPEKFKEINEAYTQILKGHDPQNDFPEFFAEIMKMTSLLSEINNMGMGIGIGGIGSGMGIGNFIKGPTITTTVNMSLEQLEIGGTFNIIYRRKIPTGKMKSEVSQTPFGIMQVMTPEEIEKNFEIEIYIPSCHDHTKPLIFHGLAKADNLPPGDLHVFITLEKHNRFKRIGGSLDLETEIQITLKEALTGFQREILMLNNEKPDIIELESIVNPYEHKRIKGFGMQCGENTGYLIVKFKILFPVLISEESKEILRNIEDL